MSGRIVILPDFDRQPHHWVTVIPDVDRYVEQGCDQNLFFTEGESAVVRHHLPMIDKGTGRVVTGALSAGLWGRLTAIALSMKLMSNQRKAARRFKLHRVALNAWRIR